MAEILERRDSERGNPRRGAGGRLPTDASVNSAQRMTTRRRSRAARSAASTSSPSAKDEAEVTVTLRQWPHDLTNWDGDREPGDSGYGYNLGPHYDG